MELRYAENYLQELADERKFTHLNPGERRLADQAEGWKSEILEIAVQIEKAAAE